MDTITAERGRPRPDVARELAQATVGVLMGGRSTEREVSLSSGCQVVTALSDTADAADGRGPARVIPVEIMASGRWRVAEEELAVGDALSALHHVDVFFFALHGGEGENGTVQGLFTCADIPFTGTGVASSGLAMDKVFTRHLMQSQGVSVAPGRCVMRAEWPRARDAILVELTAWKAPGWVVKPRCGGSSVGCTIVRSAGELDEALAESFAFEGEALVEALLEGTEVTGGVLDEGRQLRALTPIEIRPHAGRFFDYEEKYSESGALELCPPESLSDAVTERVRALSLSAHRFLRCDGYSRTDFIVPAGSDEPVFLELNTLPGLTPRSLVPLAAATDGIDYRTLCLAILEDALARVPPSDG